MSISIRTAAPGDAADLATLAALTFGLACPPGTTQDDIDDFVAAQLSRERFDGYLKDEERIILLAADGTGTPVGYTMLVGGPVGDPDVRAVVPATGTVELSKCYVLSGAHGSGVAGGLLTATLAAAAGTGASSVWLGVNQRNERAARFYGKHGFEIVGVKRFKVGGQWHDDHVRLRSLP